MDGQERVMRVLHVLSAALSPREDERAASYATLQDWQADADYHLALFEIVANGELAGSSNVDARQVRLLAATQLKNGVHRYWRKGAPNALPVDIKNTIRPKLLAIMQEPDALIAKTLALSVAKIAVLDFGTEWTSLPQDLLRSLEAGVSGADHSTESRITLHRALLVTLEIAKLLVTNRSARGRMLMGQLAEPLFGPVVSVHERELAAAEQQLSSGGTHPSGIEDIELALLCFKIASRLALYGWRDPYSVEAPKSFFIRSLDAYGWLFSLRTRLLTSIHLPSSQAAFLNKHLTAYSKLYRNLASSEKVKALNKLEITNATVSLMWNFVASASEQVAQISDEPLALFPEKIIVRALLILRSTLEDWGKIQCPDFSPDFSRNIAELLVTKLLPMRQQDIEKWSNDPEEWLNEEDSERWEYELRPCAEKLLQELVSNFKEVLTPTMQHLLQQVSSPETSGLDGLLMKEGVYCAFGGSPGYLEQAVDFDSWLNTSLIPEAMGTDENWRLIRRRIAWLMGAWVGEDLQPETRAKVYSVVIHLLGNNASTDLAIRLTSARSLSKCDTWDFKKDTFAPYVDTALTEIASLLGEVSMPESLMRLNDALGVVIGLVGKLIAPYAAKLAEMLQQLWASTTDNHFQVSLLVTMIKLAQSLDEVSRGLHPYVCPIIAISLDPELPSHIYLEEDGLELWHVLLRRASELSPEMVNLLPTLARALSRGTTDTFPRYLLVLESYLLLDARRTLEIAGVDIFRAIEPCMAVEELTVAEAILRVVDMVIRTSPREMWGPVLQETGCFARLLSPFTSESSSPFALVKYLATLSWMVMSDMETFWRLLEVTAPQLGATPEQVVNGLVAEWIDKFHDNMKSPSQRKLTALTLASVAGLGVPSMLQKLPEMTDVWTSALAETEEDDAGDADVYQAEFASPDLYDYGDEETAELGRRQALGAQDPIHNTQLRHFVQAKLGDANARYPGGPQAFEQALASSVDPFMVDELRRRLNGTLAG